MRAEKAWFEAQETASVSTDSDDEQILRGVFLPRKQSRGTVALFHGYRSSWKEDFVTPGLVRFFYSLGYQVLLPDQRAHGASDGRFLTLGVWERFDVRAWVGYLAYRFGEDHPLFLYGHSMGGTAVLMAASLELPGNVRGILADGAYTSPAELMRQFLLSTYLPLSPTLALLDLAAGIVAGFRLDDCSTLRTLPESNYPVLLIHGTKDTAVPVRMARQNYEACRSWRQLTLVDGAGHGQCWLAQPERLKKQAAMFLAEHLNDRL